MYYRFIKFALRCQLHAPGQLPLFIVRVVPGQLRILGDPIVGPSQRDQEVSEIQPCVGIVRLDADSLRVMSERLLRMSLLREEEREVKMRFGIVWVELQRFFVMTDRLS